MPYTLLKFLAWGVLLATIGGCIGWALRSLAGRSETARTRHEPVDADEVERMRHRLANLEQVVAERDRLRMQIADMRHADSPGVVGAAAVAALDDAPDDDVSDHADDTSGGVDDAVGARVATLAAVGTPDDAEPDPIDPAADPAPDAVSPPDSDDADRSDEPVVAVELDADAASDVLGKSVTIDDLTTVEGIGPKICELCHALGVTTWRQLADIEVAELRSMLEAAGSRYQMHDPTSWPQQARLLADGRWEEFAALIEELHGGR